MERTTSSKVRLFRVQQLLHSLLILLGTQLDLHHRPGVRFLLKSWLLLNDWKNMEKLYNLLI
jgi:hypothetical protein